MQFFNLKIILTSILLLCSCQAFAEEISGATKLRLGWQVPWAIQGQIVQILKNTDILKKNNLEVEFIGRTFGPELNELALAGAVDVILTADQPAATLFAKSEDWVGIARLMYNRTATYVPPKSSIKNLESLKDKTIALPVGAAAQRVLELELVNKKMKPVTDVKIVNLNIQEQVPMAKKAGKGANKWDQFDAFSGFDPVPAILQSSGLARIIHEGRVCSMVVFNKTLAEKNPQAARALTKSITEAWQYYIKNQQQADKWFVEEAKLSNIDSKVLKLTTTLEPNFSNPVRIKFDDADYVILEQAAQFIEPMVKKKVDMRSRVVNTYNQ
jgi:ABC-type nitrate/sulfonate/bicarbonate transport system substrate-binding protein